MHSVEELESRLRQEQGINKPNEFTNRTGNKEDELAAFRKLVCFILFTLDLFSSTWWYLVTLYASYNSGISRISQASHQLFQPIIFKEPFSVVALPWKHMSPLVLRKKNTIYLQEEKGAENIYLNLSKWTKTERLHFERYLTRTRMKAFSFLPFPSCSRLEQWSPWARKEVCAGEGEMSAILNFRAHFSSVLVLFVLWSD